MATAQELAIELHDIDEQIHTLALRKADVIERLAAEMPEKVLEVPGVGAFERLRKTDRKAWRSEELRTEVVKRAERKVDENGEIESEAEAQVRTLTDCARLEWRTTALRKLGLDPDEYCEVTKGSYTIRFYGSIEEISS